MLPQANDKDQLRTHLDQVRQTLDDHRLADVIGRAAQQVPGDAEPRAKIDTLLSADLDDAHSSGGTDGVPYLSRAPLVSLVQSCIEEALGDAGVADPAEETSLWSRIVHSVEHDLHIEPGSFTPDDPDWYVFIAKGALEHLADGNHPFNPHAAEHAITDDARLVIVGD